MTPRGSEPAKGWDGWRARVSTLLEGRNSAFASTIQSGTQILTPLQGRSPVPKERCGASKSRAASIFFILTLVIFLFTLVPLVLVVLRVGLWEYPV